MLLTSPLYVMQSKTKKFYLNLNVYRNAHFMVLNNTKRAYAEVMKQQVESLSKLDKIRITYTLYPKTKRLADISNILSIVDKYFCDCLVNFGKIEDDNYLYVPEVNYRIGCVDKHNPRVDIKIEPIN